ncbi:MAG: hypothetical protein QM581_13215 [Pseudomonas sp.]
MHKEPTPGSRPPRPRPRAGANARQRKGNLSLAKLVFAAIGLLLIAYFVGKRPAGPHHADPARTSADPGPQDPPAGRIATRPRSTVIRGEKSTTLANIGEARMSTSPDGLALRIDGGVGRNFTTELQRLLDGNPTLQRIDISSGGGYATTGLEAARLIRRRNLIVKVHSHCASICVALWAAAAQRQMQPDAVIGLHQWNPQCEALPSPHREECRYQAQFASDHASSYEGWLRSAGFNRYLLDLQKHTAAEDIAVLDVLQLWDNGVDFSVTGADGKRMDRSEVERYLARKRSRR